MPKNKLTLLTIILLQFFLLAAPRELKAQLNPSIEWMEIETESAYWIFNAEQQEVAEYYILQFERAKEEVLPLFKEKPRKMTVLLLDHTDVANGSAQVSPNPVIVLYTVQPSANSSIGEFRNYVHELLVHEYTHILNMDPVHGWMSPLYWIFGSIAHPNMILPRWYTEGLAVYTESKISKDGGRLNSQYLQSFARALTVEKKWKDYPLSDLNDGQLDWIGSSRAYLFGGILWDSITRDGGDEMIYKFNQSYSRRIPYFLDGVIETHVGRDYNSQLERAYQFWQLGAQKQIETLSKAPHLPGEKVSKDEDGVFYSPKISSDGLWMAYLKTDVSGSGNIHLTLRHPKRGFRGYQPKKVVAKTGGNHLAWHPAATGFVYEKLDKWQTYNQYYDLYFYDLRTRDSRRITHGLRAHSPCFSPLGKTLYFLSNTKMTKNIVAVDWLTQKSKVVYRGKIGEDLRYLSCSNEDQLYVIEHRPDEDPRVIRLDLKKKTKRSIYSETPVHYLATTHKGLLITTAANGIDNLYLLNKKRSKKPIAITNSFTRVLQGDIDPLDDGLYFNQTMANGHKLFYLNGAQWESLPDSLPSVKGIVDYRSPSSKDASTPNDKKENPEATPSSKSKYNAESFSPWRYLIPNHWIPFLYFVDGGTLYQAMTSSGDPLGINSISIVGQWDTLTKKAGVSASYLNNSTPVTLGVAASDFYNWFYATETALHYSNASGILAYRLGFLDDARLLMRWNYSQLDLNRSILIRQGPQAEISYSNGKSKPNDISISSGWRGELGHKQYLDDIGTENYGDTYAHLGTFWSSFTPGRSVFYLGVNGSYTPHLTNSFFSTSTLAGPFFNPQITNTAFLQRGYPTGVFLSFEGMVNTNAEWRFPIWDAFSGFTSPPFFLRNLQGAFVFDATTLHGVYSNSRIDSFRAAELGRWFTGYGLELETKANVGFHVPVAFTLGLYYGQEEQAYGGFTTFFNIRL